MDRAFLGVGWKFPLQVTPSGAIASSRLEQKIEESIFLILSTGEAGTPDAAGLRLRHPRPGLRAGQPRARSRRSRPAVREALVLHEPRIDVLAVDVAAAPGQPNVLLIRIDYRVRANNARGNLVYPFFITEGM